MSTAKGITSRKERDQPPTGSDSTLLLSVAKSNPKMQIFAITTTTVLEEETQKNVYYSS
jgi:hypothetical protein